MRAWAKEWAKEGVSIGWEKLLPPKGFRALPRRWVVQRTFSWIDQNRRISKRTMKGYARQARRSSTWR